MSDINIFRNLGKETSLYSKSIQPLCYTWRWEHWPLFDDGIRLENDG